MLPTIASQTNGHDWGAPSLDGLGIFYVIFAVIYALTTIGGLVALFVNRHHPAVKMRNFWIIASTVTLLLAYGVFVIIVYPLNGLFKCGCEFWVMSCFLPTSIALFQASNVRLLSYYDAQKDLADDASTIASKKKRATLLHSGPLPFWRQLDSAKKTYCGIIVGLAVQLIVTLVLFLGSRRFHASYGFFGEHVDAGACRRGLEWIPSVFWQFTWATVFGPYVLLKIRHIHDTKYWAWQTRLAIIACLPGTPLWLSFLYSTSPAAATVNRYFVPAGWFLPGLFSMQFVSIFFPLLNVYQSWKCDRQRARIAATLVQGVYDSKPGSASARRRHDRREMYSMASLDMQIEKNLDPLLQWAAQKEFTAENIVFLREVRDFRRKWEAVAKRGAAALSAAQKRERFEDAARIFFALVNPSTAKFNINIDHRTYLELSQVFSGCEYRRYDDDGKSCNAGSDACPWETTSVTGSENTMATHDTEVDKLYNVPLHGGAGKGTVSSSIITSSRSVSTLGGGDTGVASIPATFALDVFDKAFDIVKHDVFRNTWKAFEARYGKPRVPVETPSLMARLEISGITRPGSSFLSRRPTSEVPNEEPGKQEKKRMF